MSIWEDVLGFLQLMFHVITLWPLAIVRYLLPKKRKDITGEIMFITGAGSGIGRKMSIKFADLGAILICTDLNGETAKETADMIKGNGGTAYAFQLDVTDRQKVYEIADRVANEIGDVTMLVNNAGIVTGKRLLDCPDEMIRKTLDVNCTAHFWTIKSFLGSMIKNNHGHIISIASIAGFTGAPQVVDYCASKFGAVGLHDALFIELSTNPSNKVNMSVVCPFFINTGMFDGAVSTSPLTLPFLEVDDAVDQIVSGVLNNDVEIFIPKTMMVVVVLKSIIPTNLRLKIANYMNTDGQMLGFVGRHGRKKKD